MEEGRLLDRVFDGAPFSLPRCQCLGPSSSRLFGGVGGFPAGTLSSPCSLEVLSLLCPGEGVWPAFGSSGIQVVIKIIIIIKKKSEET